jgi:hypothetical protein
VVRKSSQRDHTRSVFRQLGFERARPHNSPNTRHADAGRALVVGHERAAGYVHAVAK